MFARIILPDSFLVQTLIFKVIWHLQLTHCIITPRHILFVDLL